MKLGVAISGCGIGAVTADRIPDLLGRMGLVPDCIACCSVAALPMSLFKLGWNEEALSRQTAVYAHALNRGKIKKAFYAACAADQSDRHTSRMADVPVLLCASDIITAAPMVFSIGAQAPLGMYACPVHRLPEVLPGVLGMTYGVRPQNWNGRLLCDFSLYFGNPLFPLKQLGAERILLVHFENARQREPVVICADRMIRQGDRLADVLVRVPDCFADGREPDLTVARQALSCAFEQAQDEILQHLIF